jgi:hypothetical protein
MIVDLFITIVTFGTLALIAGTVAYGLTLLLNKYDMNPFA